MQLTKWPIVSTGGCLPQSPSGQNTSFDFVFRHKHISFVPSNCASLVESMQWLECCSFEGRRAVPAGHLTTAQHFSFSAGISPPRPIIPKGRRNSGGFIACSGFCSTVPSGLKLMLIRHPRLKPWAIVRSLSLRDNRRRQKFRVYTDDTAGLAVRAVLVQSAFKHE